MQPRKLWPENPIFVEIGIQNADLAIALRREGYSKYLGVSAHAGRIESIQVAHPELADKLTYSRRRKLVLNNNAEVLILSGWRMLNTWKYRSVRHAPWVTWPASLHPLSLVALLGCLWHMISRRYSWPRIVALQTPAGKTKRLFASRPNLSS